MECKTNRESVKDLEENLETNSDIALWKYIGPKIGEARNILFSAILDILDKSKSEEHILRRDSLNSIHWKSAKKSIWTLSTTTDRQGSLRNIHLDSSVFQVLDNLSCTTDNKGTSRQSFNLRNQSTENLEKVVLGRKNAVCVRLNRKAKTSTDIAKLSVQQKKHVGTSSMGLFSQDSIASKKSYYSVKRKKNLVIKCDYSNKSQPLSKHVLQVYQHQSSQVVPEEKSTNVSNEKLLVDEKEISKETKGESRESKSNVTNTTTVNMSVTNIACEKRNCKKSRRHKKSLQHKWSFMSLNRRHVNRGKHEVESSKTSAQSTSYRAKFSKILSKLFNAGLQFSSITHRKDVEKRNNFHDSSPSVTPSSSDTSTLSADDFRNSSKYRTSKRHDLHNRRSYNIPPPVALSYNNIPCAAPLFVPILNLPGSEQCKKELRKPPDNKPSINSSFKLYPRSSKTRKFIDSFCGLKSRILASASRGKAPDTQTPPSSSGTSIFSSCNSKTKYDLNRSMEKLPAENRPAFSPNRREEIRRESPTSRFEIPNGLRYERHHSPKIVASEIENPRRPTFDLPEHRIMVENSDSSNSDLAYSDNSFTLLSKEAFFSAKPATEPCCIPERKYSYDTPKYSISPPKRSSPEDIFSTRHLYERPKVDHPYSPPSSENDFHYQNSYYPYQYMEHTSTPDEHMYYRGDNTYPQYLSAENEYPPSSMFSRAPSFMPARPISCPLPGKLPNLPPHLLAPQPPIPYYDTDPYSPPYYTYTGSQSYFVDPFTSCSTKSPTSSGSSVHYPLDPPGRPYSYRHDVPSTRSLREHLWYPHGQNMLPEVFDYQKYVNPDDQEEFSRFGKSRSLSVPAYPMESFGSECLMDPNYSAPKVRRSKMPKYMGYPHPLPQGPFNIMHPPNHPYYPQFPENPRELTQPSGRYHSRKHLQMDIVNRPNGKRRSTKSSCHSILLDQRISTRKGMGHGRQLVHSSSSVASITYNSSPKYEPRNSSGSCSDVSVSRSSATILLSKYKSIDGKYKYQYRSSCTSSKTQTSESIMNFQSIQKRKKRVSCDCSKSRSKPMPLKRNAFNAPTRHNSLYHCKQNEIPSESYRNMIGLRSQVCSSATDVYWNFKFKYGKIKHFDDRIKFELQKIGIDQLIEASKPAKCCKQTILNQPTKGNLPYAASLASLPLDDSDIKVIKQSVKMASKKKDFNCGDSPETRKKLMYYANILSDDYNMRKPKVEPQYEIRYMYYKLYDEENVENLVNKKYNEKVKNKLDRLVSFLLERPRHNPKLIFEASLKDHFERQSLVKSVFKENRYFVNRPTIVPHEQSRLLRGYLVIKSGIPPGLSESSKVALRYNIDEWYKLFSNSSCSEPQFDELLFKDERSVLSRTYKKLSSMNISAAYRNFKKKTKKCLNSEELIPKMNIYDLNELMKSQIIESIVDKYEMMIVYSVQCFESRICLKNICQHSYKSLQRSILSTPSIQLRLESCLSGLEAILRIIANFKTYVEKAITDDDKLLNNLEQYLRLKMKVSISDTFNNAINFEVNIDKLEKDSSFFSSKGKFTGKTKSLCCKSENYERYCCDKNRRLIKLIHRNQIVHSSIINPKISSKLMQELVTMSRNYSNEKHFYILNSTSEYERFRQKQTYLGDNFQEVISEGLNNNHTVYETPNGSPDIECSIFRGEEFLSKHFLRNISKKNINNNEGKLIIDLNEMNIILVQQNSRNKKRFSNPSVFFSFPSFSSGDNQISCRHTTNKIIVLVNNFHDSKISFLQMMSSRIDIDKLYIHCVDVEILTSKCRFLCSMKRSGQLDYSRHILSNVSGISRLFQCTLRDYIFYSRTVFLNRIDIVDKLKVKPSKLIKYSMYSTEIPNCLLNHEETNSLEHLEESFKNIPTALVLQMWPRCSPTTGNQIQNETVENYQLFGMAAQLGIFETMKTAKCLHNQHKIRKMKRGHQKKNLLKKYYKSSYNSSRFVEYQMDINKESRPSSGKLEIEDEKTGDYGKQSGKRCQQKFPSEETKVTTILPCLGTSGGIVQRSGDSLESLLDDCLENGKLMNQGEMDCAPKSKKARSKNDISSNQNHENRNVTTDSSLSVSNIEAKISSKDAFLCNLPNAPPFILKMNKTSFGTELTSEKEEASKKDCKETCSVKNDISSIMDSLELDRASHTSSTLYPTNKGYSEMSEHNLFIDNTCPTISNREFRTFLGKSISFIKNSRDILQDPSRGCFMSSPTVCLTGLSGFSISPFTMDEKDSRKRCQSIAYRPSTDILSNETSHQHQSKIPRMLHPGKYKVHTKMKNVQLTPGSKGYGKSQACSSRGCRDHCGAENNDIPINTIHNVANTCASKTKTCAAANARSEKRGSVIKNWPPQIQSSQPPVGDCVKGIKSDPGCYCPNIRDESVPCPVRLKENFPMDEEETPKEEEDNEDMCYCAPGEQPLLMKKSNIECDCANRNRCENETLVEPPVEKPNVFWALTKVSLLKDGTKNFEIIDVSPLPPGYYLMPEANNLILVGPQPKPVKGPPNKNCTCK